MFGGLATRDLLERKYANMERETAARAAEAASAGMLRKAQAGLATTQAGLMPKQAESEMALSAARTANLGAETSFLAPRYGAEINYRNAQTTGLGIENQFAAETIRANLGLTRARTRTEGAQAGMLGAQSSALRQDTDENGRPLRRVVRRPLGLAPVFTPFGSEF